MQDQASTLTAETPSYLTSFFTFPPSTFLPFLLFIPFPFFTSLPSFSLPSFPLPFPPSFLFPFPFLPFPSPSPQQKELPQRAGGGASRNHGKNEGGSRSEDRFFGVCPQDPAAWLLDGQSLSSWHKLLRWQAGMWPQALQLLHPVQEGEKHRGWKGCYGVGAR